MDCILYGVTKSQTRLSDFHFHRIPKWERKMDNAMKELACELATMMDCLMILHRAWQLTWKEEQTRARSWSLGSLESKEFLVHCLLADWTQITSILVTFWPGPAVAHCRGPAPVDPGNSKRGRRQRGSGNNCLIKL